MSRTNSPAVAGGLAALLLLGCPTPDEPPTETSSQSATSTTDDSTTTEPNDVSTAESSASTSSTAASPESGSSDSGRGTSSTGTNYSSSGTTSGSSSSSGSATNPCEGLVTQRSCEGVTAESGARCFWLDAHLSPEPGDCKAPLSQRCVLLDEDPGCFGNTCSNAPAGSAFFRADAGGVEVLNMVGCRVPVFGEWTNCVKEPSTCSCWCELLDE